MRRVPWDANKRFEAEFLEREAEKRAADADFVAATLEAESAKTAAFKSDEATAASTDTESGPNLGENHQQAIDESLKLYQETIATRRRNM